MVSVQGRGHAGPRRIRDQADDLMQMSSRSQSMHKDPRYCVFYILWVCVNPASAKVHGCHFFNITIQLCDSVAHFGKSQNISNVFIIIIFFMEFEINDVTIIMILQGYARIRQQN